ncbi:MAG: pyridoxamine 5'-phosphate oxidase family protein [Deltaproteobacteria bacterium]|nr:pyridoxamine 5'-phosphate oxidase family protein [Deltaproteobacteria bacterium]
MSEQLSPAARELLDAACVPVRIACTDAAGWPALVSLWFLREGDTLWCATPARAQAAAWLAREPRCGFEVSTNEVPYRGVRGRALARVVPERGKELLGRLASRYLGEAPTPFSRWLLSRDEPEVALALTAVRATHWDFSQRMQGR